MHQIEQCMFCGRKAKRKFKVWDGSPAYTFNGKSLDEPRAWPLCDTKCAKEMAKFHRKKLPVGWKIEEVKGDSR